MKQNINNQMNKKIIIGIALLIVLLISLSQVAFATGIRPAKTTIISDEGKEYSKEIWVVNNDEKEFTANIEVIGEMAKYITLGVKELTFRKDDMAKVIPLTISLPEDIPPGRSGAEVVVQEKIGGTDSGFSATLLLKHKIIIEGPYPDKFVKAKMNFKDNGQTIEMISEVENIGKENIDTIKTTFYVNDKQQEEHAITTETSTLNKNENKLLKAQINRELFTEGEFTVSGVTEFDGNNVEVTKNLRIGEPEVEITYFDKYFKEKAINPYTLDLLNNWNKELQRVFVNIDLKQNNQTLDSFRTKSVDIDGHTTERIEDFIDAQDKNSGKYVFEMVVQFLDQYEMKKKVFQAEFLPEDKFNSVGRASAISTTSSSKGIGWLVASFFILISIILSLLFLRQRPRKGKSNHMGDDF